MEFINNISFRFIQPDQVMTPSQRKWQKRFQKMGLCLDIVNARLPEDDKVFKKVFGKINKIQRMSTFAIGAIINKIVKNLPDNEVYVNVGVWKGYTFFSGLLNNSDKACIGVDNFSQFKGVYEDFNEYFKVLKSDNHHFYMMDYEEYFQKKHKEAIGLYYYDGEHSYKNQLKGLQVAEPYFSDKCIILVDNTNLSDAKNATLDFIKNSSHRYEVLFDKNTAENMHPTFWGGLMILRKVS